MKNLIFRTLSLCFVLALAIILTFTMCKKAESPQLVEEPPIGFKPSCDDSCSECDAFCYPKTVLDAIRDDSDLANNEMNIITYHFAKALNKTLKDPNARRALYKVLRDKKENISTSFAELSVLGQVFEQKFKSELENVIASSNIYPSNSNGDPVKFLLTKIPASYQGYSIGVHGMNLVNFDDEYTVPVAIAEDVNACGDIAGWSNEQEQLISEKEVIGNKLSIAIVGPYSPHSTKNAVNEAASAPTIDRVAMSLDWTQYQIKKGYRYEASGPSQVHHKFIGFYNTTNTVPPFANFVSGVNNGSLARVKKCDVNDSKSFTNSPAVGIQNWDPVTGFLSNYFFMVAYEYDWWADWKELEAPCGTGSTVVLPPLFSVKMKFDHEWYFKLCDLGNNIFPSNGSIYPINNEKCSFTFVRRDF
jgi:hypothetical protein